VQEQEVYFVVESETILWSVKVLIVIKCFKKYINLINNGCHSVIINLSFMYMSNYNKSNYYCYRLQPYPILENKTGSQTIDFLTKRLVALGAVHTGHFLVDCETYISVPQLGKARYFNIKSV